MNSLTPDGGLALARTLALADITTARDFFLTTYKPDQPEMVQTLDRAIQFVETARYTFAATGRPVVNRVASQFGFKDGLILAQRDGFDFPSWLKQALGWRGVLFGRTAFLQNAVRREARKRLDAFMRKG